MNGWTVCGWSLSGILGEGGEDDLRDRWDSLVGGPMRFVVVSIGMYLLGGAAGITLGHHVHTSIDYVWLVLMAGMLMTSGYRP